MVMMMMIKWTNNEKNSIPCNHKCSSPLLSPYTLYRQPYLIQQTAPVYWNYFTEECPGRNRGYTARVVAGAGRAQVPWAWQRWGASSHASADVAGPGSTSQKPSPPLLPRPGPTRAARLRRSWAKTVDSGQSPAKPPARPPYPVLLGGQSGAQKGTAAAFRFSDSAQPRKPRYPRPPTQASHPQRGLRHTCRGSATAPSQRRFQAPPSVTPRRPGSSRVLSRPGAWNEMATIKRRWNSACAKGPHASLWNYASQEPQRHLHFGLRVIFGFFQPPE